MTPAPEWLRQPGGVEALCGLWGADGGDAWITLRGWSMMPGIPPGTRLRLSAEVAALRPGDVIAVRAGAALVIHRLARVERGPDGQPLYVCQGDANPHPDPPAPAKTVVGVVREVESLPLLTRWRLAGEWRFSRALAKSQAWPFRLARRLRRMG